MSDYNLGTASGRIVVNGDPAAAGFKVAQGAAESFYGAVQGKVQQVEDLGKKLTVVGAAGVAGFGLAVKAASSFQTNLDGIRAVSGATEEQMEKVRLKALQLGKDTAFSANESALAMEELIKAGLTVEETLAGAADATVALAAAGGVSLPEAATIASNAMNQFNLSAEDMVGVADSIAGAANASAIDVGQFGQSLSQVGAVANVAGLSFDDTAVAIAELGNAGIKGSDAGTSLKTMLMNLIPVTDKQVDEFERLGISTFSAEKGMAALRANGVEPLGSDIPTITDQLKSLAAEMTGTEVGSAKAEKAYRELLSTTGTMQNQFFTAEGQVKSMAEIQQVLQDATGSMSEQQKLASLEILFGADAIRAAAVLSKDGAAGYNEMAAAMGQVSAADVAKTRMDNLSGSIEEFKGSLETAQIIIGEQVIPVVRYFVDALTKLINVFLNLPVGVQKAIGIFFAVGTAISLLTGAAILLTFALAPLLAKFIAFRALSAIGSVLLTFVRTMYATRSATLAYAAAKNVATAAIARFAAAGKIAIFVAKALRLAFLVITSPIFLIIAAIVALGVILYKTFPPFRKIVDQVAAFLKDKLLAALERIKTMAVVFWSALQGGAQSKNFTGLLKFAAQAGEMFRAALLKIKEAALQFWATIKANLIPALMDMWSAIQSDLIPALVQAGTAILGAIKAAWPFIKVVLKIAAIIVGVVILALIKWYTFLAGTLIPIILNIAGPVIGFLIKAIAAIVIVVVKVIAALIRFAVFLVSNIGPALMWLWNMVKTVFNGIWSAIKFAFGLIVAIITGYIGIITGIWSAFWGVFGGIITATWDLIVALVRFGLALTNFIIQAGLALAVYIFKTAWNFISNIVSEGLKIIVDVIHSIWDPVAPYFEAAFNVLKAIFSTAWDFVKTVTTTVFNAVKSVVVSIWNAVASFISGAVSRIKGYIAVLSAIAGMVWGYFQGAYDAARDRIEALLGIVGGIAGRVTRAVGNLGSILFGAGKAIIQGLIRGVESMIGALTSKLNFITKLIPDNKGPARKDKVLLEQNGEWIMGGLIHGVENMVKPFVNLLQGITTDIPGLVQPSMAAVAPPRTSAAAIPTQRTTNINTTVNNPKPETASESVNKRLRRLEVIGAV